MPRARDILSAARGIAVWLLVVCVFLGPVGLGASSASAAALNACSDSCPCDEAGEADHDDGGEAAEHEDDTSGDEKCPEDCPGCGPGVALTVDAWTMPTTPLPSARELASVPSDAATTGAFTGVFRPPRSRI